MFLFRNLSLALLLATGVFVSALRGLIPGLPPKNAVAKVASAASQSPLDCTLPACIAMMQPSGVTSETVAGPIYTTTTPSTSPYYASTVTTWITLAPNPSTVLAVTSTKIVPPPTPVTFTVYGSISDATVFSCSDQTMMTVVEGTPVCNGPNKILSTIHTTLAGHQSIIASINSAGAAHGRRGYTPPAYISIPSVSETRQSPSFLAMTTTTIWVTATPTPTVKTITSIIYPSTIHSVDSSNNGSPLRAKVEEA